MQNINKNLAGFFNKMNSYLQDFQFLLQLRYYVFNNLSTAICRYNICRKYYICRYAGYGAKWQFMMICVLAMSHDIYYEEENA